MSRPPILLLGLDCRTGLQSARLFAARGVQVFGVADDPASAYCCTRAVSGILPAEPFRRDPRPFLARLVATAGEPPVLLPCSDEFVLWLSRSRDLVHDVGRFVLASPLGLTTVVEKTSLYRHAIERRLAIPATRFLRNRRDAEAAAGALAFPAVLKPSLHGPAWLAAAAGRKVLRVGSGVELLSQYDRCAAAVEELVVQEWIPGSDQQMYSLYSYIARDGTVAAQMVVRKIRQWPPETGVGSLAVEADDTTVRRIGLDLLQGVGFVGLSSVQLKRHAGSGAYFIIEVNAGRPALNMPVAELCGVEMQLSYYCDAAGLPLPAARTVTRPGGKWLCAKTDLASAYCLWRRGDLGLGEWVRSLRGFKTHAVWSWRDPAPFLLDLLRKAPTLGRFMTHRRRLDSPSGR